MTDPKRLLDKATPLPWRDEQFTGALASATEPTESEIREYRLNAADPTMRELNRQEWMTHTSAIRLSDADAALIVYAVNNLPAYERCVEALDEITKTVYAKDTPLDSPSYSALHLRCVGIARAALAALRGEVPLSDDAKDGSGSDIQRSPLVQPGTRPCPACGAALGESETHWSLGPAPMGGYVCPGVPA